MYRAEWQFEGTRPDAISPLRRQIVERLETFVHDREVLNVAAVVISELLTNVVRHAPGLARVTLDETGRYPTLIVRDNGPGFTLDGVSSPNVETEDGRGWYLIRCLTRSARVVPRCSGGARVIVELETAPRRWRTMFLVSNE